MSDRLRSGLALPIVLGTLLLSAARAQQANGLAEPLNVLFLMTDQHNARTLGSSDNGFGGVQGSLTPSLDGLAAAGVRFENAKCATPVCRPSRWTIFTGLWPHNHGVRTNHVWEPRNQVLFSRLARDAGYVTGTVGKHHILQFDRRPFVDDFGFDVIVDETDYEIYCHKNGVSPWGASGNFWAMPGLPGEMDRTGYTNNSNAFHPSGYFADRALEFLDARAGAGGDGAPFVLFYLTITPHTPILPTGPADPQDWAHRFQPFEALSLPPNLNKIATTARLAALQATYSPMSDEEHREALSYYYGQINQIDFNVGRILRRLESLGLAEKTLVIYTADHGDMATEMGCWTKDSGAYDAIVEVPLLARLPGVFPAGLVTDELTSNVDMMPTLLELTGIPIEDEDRARLDGESLVPIMTGAGTPTGWRDVVFAEHGHPLTPELRFRMAATREGKFAHDELGGEEEYYELSSDPFEIDDRIADPDPAVQATIASLRSALVTWWNGEAGHAPYYRESFGVPSASVDPFPADDAADVPCDVDPTWLPSTAANAQLALLGTDPASLAPFMKLFPMADNFNPGTLAPSTNYYWRIDGTNYRGTTVGPVWHFKTAVGGAGGPQLARSPQPIDREPGVALRPTLVWTPAADVVSQDCLFGRAGHLVLVSAGLPPSAGSFAPGVLEGNVAYEWRVDGTSMSGTTVGDVWSFTTDASGLPGRAHPVAPLHLASSVPVQPGFLLSWAAGASAQSSDVYFGSTFPLPFRESTTATTFAPQSLQPGTTYYWRIDGVNASGTTRGFSWRFTTQ